MKIKRLTKSGISALLVLLLVVSMFSFAIVSASSVGAVGAGKTVFFSNNQNWSIVYCYAWGEGGSSDQNAPWPGVRMTFHEYNDYGEGVYKYTITKESRTNVIFNGGDNAAQTPDIDISGDPDGIGFYPTGTVTNGKYEVARYTHYVVCDMSAVAYTNGVQSEDGGYVTVSASTATPGESVTFTAHPETGYNFEGWYSDAELTQEVSTSEVYDHTVSDDTVLYASFSNLQKITLNLSASKDLVSTGESFKITASVKKAVSDTAAQYYYMIEQGATTYGTTAYASSDKVKADYSFDNQGLQNIVVKVEARTATGEVIGRGKKDVDVLVVGSQVPFAESTLYFHAANQTTNIENFAWTAAEGNTSNKDVVPSLNSPSSASTLRVFLPSSADLNNLQVYNNTGSTVSFGSTTIENKGIGTVSLNAGSQNTVTVGSTNKTLKVQKTASEASIFVNDVNKTVSQMTSALKYSSTNAADKDNSVITGCFGSVALKNGSIVQDTNYSKGIKIKGRGNSTWTNTTKKSFNVTFGKKLNIDGVKGKKFSLLANFQEYSLLRNELTLNLSDQVGVPYASDTKTVDLYLNGVFVGVYTMCEKIEPESLVAGVLEDDHIDANGNLKDDFSFLMEVDSNASASSGDYFISTNSGNKITLKSPELEAGDVNYNAVLNYAKIKFDAMFNVVKNSNATYEQLSEVIDVESFAKYYLINELTKCYDTGVTSCYFSYQLDPATNTYKFYASPVWDYDNALGNGGGSDSSYTSPKNWYVEKRVYPSGSSTAAGDSKNITAQMTTSKVIMSYAKSYWFGTFVPVLQAYENGQSQSHLLSRAQYKAKLDNILNTNYAKWNRTTSGGWIGAQTSLKKITFNYDTGVLTEASTATTYPDTPKGQFDYVSDWMLSRAAWMSKQWYYPNFYVIGDEFANSDGNNWLACDDYKMQRTSTDDGEMAFVYENIAPEKFVVDGTVKYFKVMSGSKNGTVYGPSDVSLELSDLNDYTGNAVAGSNRAFKFANADGWSGVNVYYYPATGNVTVKNASPTV